MDRKYRLKLKTPAAVRSASRRVENRLHQIVVVFTELAGEIEGKPPELTHLSYLLGLVVIRLRQGLPVEDYDVPLRPPLSIQRRRFFTFLVAYFFTTRSRY